jgi:ubiquinone/menaquinone biosynthesis C-methylase UbiE
MRLRSKIILAHTNRTGCTAACRWIGVDMFNESYRYYDKIYAHKDYAGETIKLRGYIEEHLNSPGDRLLDVACGTGEHIWHLKEHFKVEGLDLTPGLLQIAQEKNPEITFHVGDMIDFDLGKKFDILTCLFSSIGYVQTLENLGRAIGSMARHLVPGGLLLIEPWFTSASWTPGFVHVITIDEPELKIARMNTSVREGRISYLDLHYLIGTPEGTEHFVEHHELGLFEVEETKDAVEQHGLEVLYEEEGIAGRGMYIGKKPM